MTDKAKWTSDPYDPDDPDIRILDGDGKLVARVVGPERAANARRIVKAGTTNG